MAIQPCLAFVSLVADCGVERDDGRCAPSDECSGVDEPSDTLGSSV